MNSGHDHIVVAAVAAVTPVGLNAVQTCSALRAGISGIRQTILRPPPKEPLLVASVPTTARLRRGDREWLGNLACRAIREALSKTHLSSERIALLLSLPEPYREHPAFFRGTPEVFLGQIERQMKARFNKRSCVLVGGHAAPIQALKIVDALLRSEGEACLLCGVDSLLNSSDVECLSRAGRLRDMNHPQGVIPGEGAACVLLTRPESTATQLSSIAGWAEAQEPNSVLGDNYSVGDGLAQAIADAAGAAQIAETDIDFRVSDMNGERYRAWESFLAGTRYYRTHRERLPLQLPAMAVGDLGAAASVLNLVVTATSISRGYAPGPIACCESSSAQGSRAAAIVIPAQGAPTPPFRSRHVPT